MNASLKRLDEVCEVEYGTRVVNKRDGGSRYPVYGGGGATFKMDAFNRCDRMVVARFAMSQACTRFVTGEFFLNDSGLTVSARSSALQQRFLDYQLIAKNDEIFALGKGSAQKNLDVPAFRGLQLFVPDSVDEQQRIVAILDEAFAGIATAKANAERNFQNARDVFEGALQEAFSNLKNEHILGDLCSTSAGGTPLSSRKEYYENGAIPWLLSGEVCRKEIISASKCISQKGLENSSAKIFPTNTVLVAMYGATAGQVGILRFASSTNQAVCGIFPSNEFLPEFLFYLFVARKNELVAQAAGNAQPNISQAKIRSLSIPMPSIDLQRTLIEELEVLAERTGRLESICTRKLTALDELKQSLLHQAFSGKL